MREAFNIVGHIGGFAPFSAAVNAQDVEAGKAVFKKCSACHAADGTTNKVGPHLGDLIGRTAGTVEGFNYSKAIVEAGTAGLVWDETSLPEYLLAPKAKVPGTKMAVAGLKSPMKSRISSPI